MRKLKKWREYEYLREAMAGCYQCGGLDMKWYGPNAQGVAARHHDATGHQTWVEVHLTIYYGGMPKDPFKQDPIPEKK